MAMGSLYSSGSSPVVLLGDVVQQEIDILDVHPKNQQELRDFSLEYSLKSDDCFWHPDESIWNEGSPTPY